jgi:hypothetical protein
MMLTLPGKLIRAVSDVTVGTAIVMVHVMLADRERSAREAQRVDSRRLARTTATSPMRE